jgi:adenylate cyclase
VNLTARIESHSVGGQVLISDSTLKAAGGIVKIGRRIEVHAKGFREPITAYDVHGVGGPYGIDLDTVEPPLVALARAVPVRYAIVDEKTVDETERDAALRSLSPRKALLAVPEAVEPLKNIRFRLVGATGEILPGDVYAKVLEAREAPGESLLEIRFTSLPEEIAAKLSLMLEPV